MTHRYPLPYVELQHFTMHGALHLIMTFICISIHGYILGTSVVMLACSCLDFLHYYCICIIP
jgi:hypothetical protein